MRLFGKIQVCGAERPKWWVQMQLWLQLYDEQPDSGLEECVSRSSISKCGRIEVGDKIRRQRSRGRPDLHRRHTTPLLVLVLRALEMSPCILVQDGCSVARPSADDSSVCPTVNQTDG